MFIFFSPSFSATTVLSALFFAPSSSFYVAMYAFVSLVDSFVISSVLLSSVFCSRRHIKYHLRVPFSLFLSLTLHQRFVLRPFTRTPLCVFSSPFLLPSFRASPSFSHRDRPSLSPVESSPLLIQAKTRILRFAAATLPALKLCAQLRVAGSRKRIGDADSALPE